MKGITVGFSHKMVYPKDKVYCIWITYFSNIFSKSNHGACRSKLGACYTIYKIDSSTVYLMEGEEGENSTLYYVEKEKFKASFVSLQEFRKRKLKRLEKSI